MLRRSFIKKLGLGSAMLGTGTFPALALSNPETIKLTVLHTNDVHSRIDPFPMDGGRFQGVGGVARRAALIDRIRKEEEHVLLVDAGDIFQGTPYFNYYGGELEFKLMSRMGYEASTIGNHDFDAGIDGLLKQLPHAQFPFINGNYDFSNTIMEGRTLPYKTFTKGPLKIGITGVGIALKGLVPQNLYKETKYLDPIEMANHYAAILKEKEKCDLVICLSHLGYRYRSSKVSDIVLAEKSRHIDLIIGGHTHTFLDKPEVVRNMDKEEVLINQVGWGGIVLGRLDIHFERNRRNRCMSCGNLLIKE